MGLQFFSRALSPCLKKSSNTLLFHPCGSCPSRITSSKFGCNSVNTWHFVVFKLFESNTNLVQADVRVVFSKISDQSRSWVVTIFHVGFRFDVCKLSVELLNFHQKLMFGWSCCRCRNSQRPGPLSMVLKKLFEEGVHYINFFPLQ